MPSPPHDDERLDAVGDALAGQVERLVGVAARQVADDEPGVAQPRQRQRRARGRPLPLPAVGLVSSAISRGVGRARHGRLAPALSGRCAATSAPIRRSTAYRSAGRPTALASRPSASRTRSAVKRCRARPA